MRHFDFSPLLRGAALPAAFSMLQLPAAGALAQSEDIFDEFPEYFEEEARDPPPGTYPEPTNRWGILVGRRITPDATESVTSAILGSYAVCARVIPEEYQVDCLREQLEEIAAALPDSGEYAEAKDILEEAARKLDRIVRANASPTLPPVRASTVVSGKPIKTKPLRAVRPESVRAAKRQAAAVIEEAETKLLRSAQASDRRLIAYAQMARAVGSNKTLLRSA
ncbi:MAG: hypothetical protein AAF744_05000 [Pseudomonadota bacterium]